MKDANVGGVEDAEAVIQNPQRQVVSLAANEQRSIVVASLFEDFPANSASTFHKIEGVEFLLPKIFPVASVTPFPYPDVPGVGFAHLKRQDVDVGPLRIF